MKPRFQHAVFAGALALLVSTAHVTVQAQDSLRPEVGKPLQAAQELIKAQKFKEALAKVREADAVSGKSANESYLTERMRIAAASGAGDIDTAAKAFDAIGGNPKLGAADKLRMIESLAGGSYRAGNYARAMQWSQRYFKEGGNSPAIRTLLIQSQYLSGDFAGAQRELSTEIQAAEKAGNAPPEERIKLLMNAALKQNDTSGYVSAVEKLVTYYPKKEYWVDLLSRLQRKPNFSDRLALDTYRLSLATGSMSKANDYMEMAQLAVQAGFPSEGKQVVDKGFAAGILGVGAEAERHKRLRDLMVKRTQEDEQAQAANLAEAMKTKDGNDLVNVGFNQVLSGQAAKGVTLMQQGIAKGNLKRAEDAKLHLGIAQTLAGDGAKAQATFKTVTGTDGTADLARLWALYARRKS
jgi:DNA-binding phage protein/outer membrane protein assembly factor BamD (BamD/ComL family)